MFCMPYSVLPFARNTLSPLDAAVPVSIRLPKLLIEMFGIATAFGLFCTHPPSANSQPLPDGHPLNPEPAVGINQSWMNRSPLDLPGGFSYTNCSQPAQLGILPHADVVKKYEFSCNV